MTTLTGTFAILRFLARLDRVRVAAWVGVLGMLPVVVALSFVELYPDALEREQLVLTVSATPTLTALLGSPLSSSIGGLTVWRVGTIVALLVGLFAGFTVIRHTRQEEETGRSEMLAWTAVGRHAPLTAALLLATAGTAVVGFVAGLGLVAVGEPLTGAAAFALGLAGIGLVFAAVGAVAAQLTQGAGPARGFVSAFVGVAFTLRLLADGGGPDWLTWVSPIGWTQELRPFAGEQWWILGLFPLLALALIALSYSLASRRDHAAAVITPRPGPPHASRLLSSPLGLVVRLQRVALVGWIAGFAVWGVGVGSLQDGLSRLLDENPQLAAIFEAIGGDLSIEVAFRAALFGILALVASAYAIGTLLELHEAEEKMLAESVLSTAVSRSRWAAAHLAPALLGPVLLLAAAGAGFAAVAPAAEVVGAVGGALVQVPAVWVMVAIAMAIYGFLPRRTGLAWIALVAFALAGQLGELLRLPDWAINLSPFSHIPLYPASSFDAGPLVALVGVTVVLTVAGLVGFNRRDLA